MAKRYVKTYKAAAAMLGIYWRTLKSLVKAGYITPEPYPISDVYGIVFEVDKLKKQFIDYYIKNKYRYRKDVNI